MVIIFIPFYIILAALLLLAGLVIDISENIPRLIFSVILLGLIGYLIYAVIKVIVHNFKEQGGLKGFLSILFIVPSAVACFFVVGEVYVNTQGLLIPALILFVYTIFWLMTTEHETYYFGGIGCIVLAILGALWTLGFYDYQKEINRGLPQYATVIKNTEVINGKYTYLYETGHEIDDFVVSEDGTSIIDTSPEDILALDGDSRKTVMGTNLDLTLPIDCVEIHYEEGDENINELHDKVYRFLPFGTDKKKQDN